MPNPKSVFSPQLDCDGIADYLAEFAARICYRAWEPGLNPAIRGRQMSTTVALVCW
ncbi:hypothetical protein ACWGCW_18230 [Streptomyces sp. NPDC054933]